MPNFLGRKCLKNTNGETEYDFGEKSHFQSLTDHPCVNVKKKTKQKRYFENTPQTGARRNRQFDSKRQNGFKCLVFNDQPN